MAIVSQFVQLNQLDVGPNPATKTITGVQAGSLLVAGVAYYRHGVGNTTDPSVTDNAGTALKADATTFLFSGGLDSMGCGLWYVENAVSGTHIFSFDMSTDAAPHVVAFIAEVPRGLKSSSLDKTAKLTHGLADFATTDSLSFPLTTKGHTVRFSCFDFGALGGGAANIGITPPSGDTELNVEQNSLSGLPIEESYQEFFADAARTITWNWTDASSTGITSGMVAANFGLIDAGAVIGAVRTASRYVGPQVRRFLFRAPRNELFGGMVLDPPGEIVGAARIANPKVGPSALRRVFRQPSFQWPVVPAGGATTVLASLATHTYTAQVPQVRARVAPAQATHTYAAQAPQVRVKVQPAQATHTYTAQVPQVRVKVQPAQATHTYTARVPNIVTGSAVVPPTATHSYTARTPQAKARVAPAAMTHSYTGQAPQARSKVQPAQVTHAYTARAPQTRANVQPAPVTHSYLGRVPQAKSKVAPAAAVHSYTGRIPAVQAGNVVFAARAIHVYAGVAPSITAAPPVYGSPTRPAIGDGGARPAQTGGARPAQIDTSRRRN